MSGFRNMLALGLLSGSMLAACASAESSFRPLTDIPASPNIATHVSGRSEKIEVLEAEHARAVQAAEQLNAQIAAEAAASAPAER